MIGYVSGTPCFVYAKSVVVLGSNSTLQVRCLLQLSRFQVYTDMSVNFNVWRDGNELQVAGGNINLLIFLFTSPDFCGTTFVLLRAGI